MALPSEAESEPGCPAPSISSAVQMVRRHPTIAARPDVTASLSTLLTSLSLNSGDTHLLECSDKERADLAYMLLLSLPAPHLSSVQSKLLSVLHFDILTLLPPELARHILQFLDFEDILRCSTVSKAWRRLTWNDQLLWKNLFVCRGWKYDIAAVDYWNRSGLSRSSLSLSKSTKGHSPTVDEGMGMDMEPGNYATSVQGEVDSSEAGESASVSSEVVRAPVPVIASPTPTRPHPPPLSLHIAPEEEPSSSNASLLPGLPPSPRHLGFHAASPVKSLSPPAPAFMTESQASSSSTFRSQSLPMRRSCSAEGFSSSTAQGEPYHRNRRLSVPRLRSVPNVHQPYPVPQSLDPSRVSSVHYSDEGIPRVNWRHMFIARITIARNWRRGRFVAHELRSPHSLHLSSPPPITPNEWPVSAEHAIYCLQIVGDTLVAGFRQAIIRQFCFETGRCLKVLKFHEGSVLCLQVAVPSDESLPLPSGQNQYPNILGLATSRRTKSDSMGDGTLIVSGSSDGTIVFGDLESGKKCRTLKGHSDSVLALKFEDDYLATCSKDHTVKLWSMSSGKLLHNLLGHAAAVNAIQLSVANSIVCSVSGDRTVKIWDIRTGQALKQFTAHDRGIATLKLQLKPCLNAHKLSKDFEIKRSPLQGFAITGSSDRTIRLHDLEKETCNLMLGTGDDGRELGWPANGWNLSPAVPLRTQRQGHTDLVRTLDADESIGIIVSGSYDQSIKIFDYETGEILVDIQEAHANRILKFQMSLTRLVSCAQDSRIIVWDFFQGDTSFMKL